NSGAGAQSAVEIDHAVSGDQRMACVLDLGADRLSRDLPDRLDQSERAAGSTGLADRQLSARGVERKTAVCFETVTADEVGAFALGAETEILDLEHADNRIIVVDLDHIDVGGSDACRGVELIAIHRPAAAV